MQPIKAARILIAPQSLAAGGTVRATLDLRTSWGGRLHAKITNGATGPTAPCVLNILSAVTDGATPTAAAEGADWKLLKGGVTPGTGNGAALPIPYPIDKDVQHLEIEFTGHTGQAVTVEAYFMEVVDVL